MPPSIPPLPVSIVKMYPTKMNPVEIGNYQRNTAVIVIRFVDYDNDNRQKMVDVGTYAPILLVVYGLKRAG